MDGGRKKGKKEERRRERDTHQYSSGANSSRIIKKNKQANADHSEKSVILERNPHDLSID